MCAQRGERGLVGQVPGAHFDHIARLQPEVRSGQTYRPAQQHAARDDEQRRHRDLRDDEPMTEPRRPPVRRGAMRRDRSGAAGGVEGGQGAEQDGSTDTRRDQRRQHARVGGHGQQPDQVGHRRGQGGVHRADACIERDPSQREARQAGDERQQQAFDKELPDDAAARCAQRQADGDLALSHGGAREHQAGEVRGGRQQHEAERDRQRRQGEEHVERQRDRRRGRLEDGHHGLRFRRIARRCALRPGQYRRPGGAFGLRGAEASDDFQPLRLFGPEQARPLFERRQQCQRRPEVAGEHVQADEAFGSDADNLDVDAADLQLLADRCQVAVKVAHPPGVAEDDDRLAPGGRAVGGLQHASAEGRDAEQGEVVARDQLAHGRPPVDTCRQPRHGDVGLGEYGGHVAAEPLCLRPRKPVEKASAVLPGRLVQRSGITHRRGRDHVGVEKRVGGCVEAERHGERPNDGQRDRWRTLEDAEREADVSPERLEAHTRLRRLGACRCCSS